MKETFDVVLEVRSVVVTAVEADSREQAMEFVRLAAADLPTVGPHADDIIDRMNFAEADIQEFKPIRARER